MSLTFEAMLPTPEYARNLRLVGFSDQGGRPDGVQLMVVDGYAYVAHMFSQGFSVIDVRDPANPKPGAYIPCPANTWSLHLQAAEDLLLVVNAKDLYRDELTMDEKSYYVGSMAGKLASSVRDYAAGVRVYDISDRPNPREIGFLALEGVGAHRLWWTGGRWAYVSAMLDGFSDYIFLTLDMADPSKPTVAGRWWIPGMAAGETPSWDDQAFRYSCHHGIVSGDTAYVTWRDGGVTLLDVTDRAQPSLIAHRNWSPPFGGGTHNALPLPGRELMVVVDEAVMERQADGVKPIWIFDIREPANPVSIATMPIPDEADYLAKGSRFGPHNVHENRPGTWVSETEIFATYNNAGVRVYDISDPFRPVETAAFVPAAPARLMDDRPGVPQISAAGDVFVDAQGLLYTTDQNGGLSILERT